MENVFGLILAGGHSSRMGQDKALLQLGNKPLIAHVMDAAKTQCHSVAISSNSDTPMMQSFGVSVVPDMAAVKHFGPLAAILTGMQHLRAHHKDCRWLLSLPTDTPYVPNDLIERGLSAAKAENAKVVLASFGGDLQQAMGLWHVSLYDTLYNALVADDVRKVMAFVKDIGFATIDFNVPTSKAAININTPEDLAMAAKKYREE